MPKLHLGCGNVILDGWINYDNYPYPNVTAHDLLETALPHADNSIEFIYSEHFIEHGHKQKMINLFVECIRVLRPGGVMRLSTPNLSHLVNKYHNSELWQIPELGWLPGTLCDMVNECMRLWGHQYIWDSPELKRVLKICGFKVQDVGYHISDYPELRNLETRPYNHEVIVEATKHA